MLLPQAPQQWQSTRYVPVDSWTTREFKEILLVSATVKKQKRTIKLLARLFAVLMM